ncbi:MAG: ABC-F family ATP-binding cassette domain-containing protein, partial [Bacteroidia bacterium]
MVSVNQLSVYFGATVLFDDVSFLVNPRDRIGLAGKNGAGKSTLLKLLAGLQEPSKGSVSRPKSCRIGYLPQDMTHQHGRTVWDETATAFTELQALELRIEAIHKALETRTDYESQAYADLLDEQTALYMRLEVLGATAMDEAIEKTLMGLGFSRSDMQRATSDFSGGWRMRIELAKLLLGQPDVLLLDEPTNHLDIEAIMWLEEFMTSFAGAVVLISHDRRFLDQVTQRTIEINAQRIFDYKASYSKYLVLREERRQQQENAAKNQQKIIQHTEQLIDKYRAKANKASFAQSLIKKLDRMERIEVDDVDNAAIAFRFPKPAHSGKIILTVEDASKYYGAKHIFSGARFIVTKGEKIGFVGRNGEGKSTMMKMIAGKTDFTGLISPGHQVSIGYFEQDQEEKLDTRKTVFETIDDLAAGEIRKQVRGLLGSFLFRGDEIDKKVSVLSGGERARLALCKLLLEPYNVLLLDEPTNHLDLRSKDILKRAIQEYEGTVIMVSHDRDFMQGICSRLFEFRDTRVKEHLCDIEGFVALRTQERM